MNPIRRARHSRLALLLIVALAGAIAVPSHAQAPPPLDLPGEPFPEIPIPSDEEPAEVLDADAPVPQEELTGLRVRVRSVRVTGNTVLSSESIAEVVEPYLNRDLSSSELEALRKALTLAYVERGFETSGALLPDQDFADGVLEMRVIEGRIADVVITGNRRFDTRYLERQIVTDPDTPVDLNALRDRLQLLQNDPGIRSVDAELRPGLALGESILSVRIREGRGYTISGDVSNDRSPAIGAENGRVVVGARSLTGWGDLLTASTRISEGLRDARLSWEIPVTRWDTRFEMNAHWAESEVVDGPFSSLDIDSNFWSGGLSLTHPVVRNLRDEVRLGLLAEWRRGKSEVDGRGFSFSDGADRGESVVAALRAIQEWVRRDANQVLAVRSTLSVGLPVLNSTDVRGASADGEFFSWILQGQWARRFDKLRGLEVVARGNLQLASDPLLSIEQFSVGGHASVRSYRENQVVRDNGFATSLEFRVPIWRRPDGRPMVQLAPFADVGRGWDHSDRSNSGGETLASVGIGLRLFPTDWVQAELYWGERLKHVTNPNDDLQDEGVYFRVSAKAF